MKKTPQNRKPITTIILLFSLLMVILSGFYLWAIIPSSELVETSSRLEKVKPTTFMGTVLESTIGQ